ncbi:MAG: hypothetical protein IBX64_05950 [Actinobacteria bacterium]|nr:hypothetical protein [Actinomycetota bacterium]
MLFRVLRDTYNFFDRRWFVVVVAAVLSVGMAAILSLVVRIIISLPPITINSASSTAINNATGSTFKLSYNDIIEAILIFIGSVWFRGFIAALVHAELRSPLLKIADILKRSIVLYPQVFLVNTVVVYIGVILALPAMLLGNIGVLFSLPALIFYIWFSLVSPVVVMDDMRGVIKVLTRSRMLVTGYFWQVLLVHAIAVAPVFAIVGIQDDTVYFWPVLIFINIVTAILGSLLITFTYINLRLVKGERLAGTVPMPGDTS